MARNSAFLSFKDYSNEGSQMGLNFLLPAGDDYTTPIANIAGLRVAVEGVSYGNVVNTGFTWQSATGAALPTEPEAQRESKWLVTYKDVTEFYDAPTNTIPNPGFGKTFNFEIPCADPTGGHLLTNSDFADLADTDVAALVTVLENDFWKSPYNGSIEVLSMQFIGVSS